MRSFPRMAYHGLKCAVKRDIVKEPKWRRRIPLGWIGLAIREIAPSPTVPNRGNYDHPGTNPLSMRYWEQTRGLIDHPGGTDPWLVELARHVVPLGHVGVVKSFEQVLDHPAIEGSLYFTASSNWGRPYILPAGVTVRWLWRLDEYNGTSPPWISTLNPAPQDYPGISHWDCPNMEDIWFPAGSPPSQNFHLLTTGGYCLRVLALIETTSDYALSVSAKIRGFDVGQYGLTSQLAIRSLW
jgi:hypothetical protein